MAKSDVLSVATVTVGGITIKRWWASKEIWNHIIAAVSAVIGLLAILAPQILPLLPTLGLSPRSLILAIVILNLALQANGVILRMRSTAIISGKDDVSEAKQIAGSAPTDVTTAN